MKNIDGIAHIELNEEDVVRHRLVKAIIKAYDREHDKEQEPHAPLPIQKKPGKDDSSATTE